MAEVANPQRPLRKKRRLGRLLLAAVVVVILGVGGFFLWRYFNSYESTDDAEVDGHIDAISARISGHIAEVDAEDEQIVKAGDVLVRIDPRDYQAALDKAEADLADAEAALQTSRIDIPITSTTTSSQLKSATSGRADATAFLLGAERQLDAAQTRLIAARAQVREAEANLTKANDDVRRYKLLVDKDEISRQQYDTAVQAAAAMAAVLDDRKAGVNEAQQNIVVAQSVVDQAKQRIGQADASVESASTAPKQVAASESRAQAAMAQVAQRKALVEQAKLNLSYCTVVAPVSGIVGKKTVELGENVSPGEQLMAVVPLDDVWIIANFKETQLSRMKAGQHVEFTVDAYDSRTYKGTILQIGGASGSRFSLLPPENATGNYVKVVQRVPVRINLDPGENKDHRLRPGLSVDPKVYLE
ncbi:MAG TPA: HlyD family secretion protein [Bryobacteraceae bacterium]|nr:HlyD family secretion protein [Bryobacteraceae bacterium]